MEIIYGFSKIDVIGNSINCKDKKITIKLSLID